MFFFAFVVSFWGCGAIERAQVNLMRKSYVPLKAPCGKGECEVSGVMVPKDLEPFHTKVIDLAVEPTKQDKPHPEQQQFSTEGMALPAIFTYINYTEKSEKIDDMVLIRYVNDIPLLACKIALSRKTFSTINATEIVTLEDGTKEIQYVQTSLPRKREFFLSRIFGGDYRPGPPTLYQKTLTPNGFCTAYDPDSKTEVFSPSINP